MSNPKTNHGFSEDEEPVIEPDLYEENEEEEQATDLPLGKPQDQSMSDESEVCTFCFFIAS